MTEMSNRNGKRIAKAELNNLRDAAAINAESVQGATEEYRVSPAAQRVILHAIKDLDLPSSDISPREIGEITRRFALHVQCAIERAGDESSTSHASAKNIAKELRATVVEIRRSRKDAIDAYVIPEMELLACSLETLDKKKFTS